ncbi:hypothetical protein VNI00_007188 [Paramarasmius palmivorus]|uniref:Ubiquitin-like protease family profile domain-containing protein n=1 Tax=Paramarasmius palmivorus TaxID=297713 RepID=A0AAW0D2W0_9AGAR
MSPRRSARTKREVLTGPSGKPTATSACPDPKGKKARKKVEESRLKRAQQVATPTVADLKKATEAKAQADADAKAAQAAHASADQAWNEAQIEADNNPSRQASKRVRDTEALCKTALTKRKAAEAKQRRAQTHLGQVSSTFAESLNRAQMAAKSQGHSQVSGDSDSELSSVPDDDDDGGLEQVLDAVVELDCSLPPSQVAEQNAKKVSDTVPSQSSPSGGQQTVSARLNSIELPHPEGKSSPSPVITGGEEPVGTSTGEPPATDTPIDTVTAIQPMPSVRPAVVNTSSTTGSAAAEEAPPAEALTNAASTTAPPSRLSSPKPDSLVGCPLSLMAHAVDMDQGRPASPTTAADLLPLREFEDIAPPSDLPSPPSESSQAILSPTTARISTPSLTATPNASLQNLRWSSSAGDDPANLFTPSPPTRKLPQLRVKDLFDREIDEATEPEVNQEPIPQPVLKRSRGESDNEAEIEPSLDDENEDHEKSPNTLGSQRALKRFKAVISFSDDELDELEDQPPRLIRLFKKRMRAILSDDEDASPPPAKKSRKPSPRGTNSEASSADVQGTKKTAKGRRNASKKKASTTRRKGATRKSAQPAETGVDEQSTANKAPRKRRNLGQAKVDMVLEDPDDSPVLDGDSKLKGIRRWYTNSIIGEGPSAIQEPKKQLGLRSHLYEAASTSPELATTSREIALTSMISTRNNLICRYHSITEKSTARAVQVDGDDDTLFGRPWPPLHKAVKAKLLEEQQKAAKQAAQNGVFELPKEWQVPGWNKVHSRHPLAADCGCNINDMLLEMYLWKTGELSSITASVTDDWRGDFLTPRQRALVCSQHRYWSLLDVDDMYSMASEDGKWVRRDEGYARRVQAARAQEKANAKAQEAVDNVATDEAAYVAGMALFDNANLVKIAPDADV